MADQYLCFTSDEGIDLYCINEPRDSFDHFWVPATDDIDMNSSVLVDEALLVKILNDYQCFETSSCIYLKTPDGLQKFSKKECFANAIDHLVDGIDRMLRVRDFVAMTPNQKSSLHMILFTIISHSKDFGARITLPIVSEIDYIKCSDYDYDEVPWKYEIPTDSPLWLEALGMIHIDSPKPVSKQYSYSHVCKNLLFR